MIKITKDNINEEIKEGIVVVLFWASWCEPCKNYLLHFIQASKMLEGKAKLGASNLDDTTPELLHEHDVQAVPCSVFYKDGKRVESVLGVNKIDWIIDKVGEI